MEVCGPITLVSCRYFGLATLGNRRGIARTRSGRLCSARQISSAGSANRNGAIADCWREFIGSRSIGCARKFSRSRLRIFIVFFSHGSEPTRNIASKVRKACNRSGTTRRLRVAAGRVGIGGASRARVADYDPEWLDRLCFSGRVGWGRLSAPQNPNARAIAPLRTSPIALYQRENLQRLADADAGKFGRSNFRSPAKLCSIHCKAAVRSSSANWCDRSGLLPSQVEEALSQLAALGLVTSDSFDGLRALLVPSNKRPDIWSKCWKTPAQNKSCQH